MPDVPTYLRRPAALMLMPDAISRGLSASAFIQEMKTKGYSYRRTNMLSDWRTVAGIEAKKDVAKYVRRDRRPSIRAIADVPWEKMSKEYMYKVKVHTQTKPGEPLKERFVNIMSNDLLTPAQIEQQVKSRWGEWERYEGEALKAVQLSSIYHKIERTIEEQ